MSKECDYVIRGNLCSLSGVCNSKYSFNRSVKVDGKDIYGVCNSASVF